MYERALDILARLQELESAVARRTQTVSGTVLVAKDGQTLFAKGYGLANVEHDVPNTVKTKFRLASVKGTHVRSLTRPADGSKGTKGQSRIVVSRAPVAELVDAQG